MERGGERASLFIVHAFLNSRPVGSNESTGLNLRARRKEGKSAAETNWSVSLSVWFDRETELLFAGKEHGDQILIDKHVP